MPSDLAANVTAQLMQELESDKLVLPSLPEVALKIREAIDDPDVDSGKIAKVISTDAALTARLIQVANSPLVRGNRSIDGLEMAVTRMGNTMVRNVANSLIVQQMFQPTTDLSDKKFRAFWEHSTQVAAISHALAGFARLKPDMALLAGLLHDIGALPVIKHAEDNEALLNNEAVLDEVIAEVHCIIGKEMLKRWDFPAEIIEVAEYHEDLQRAGEGKADYVDIVIAANLQSYMGSDHPLAQVDFATVPAFAKLGLNTEVSIVDLDGQGDNIREVQQALCA